jgi:hypothetical protein
MNSDYAASDRYVVFQIRRPDSRPHPIIIKWMCQVALGAFLVLSVCDLTLRMQRQVFYLCASDCNSEGEVFFLSPSDTWGLHYSFLLWQLSLCSLPSISRGPHLPSFPLLDTDRTPCPYNPSRCPRHFGHRTPSSALPVSSTRLHVASPPCPLVHPTLVFPHHTHAHRARPVPSPCRAHDHLRWMPLPRPRRQILRPRRAHKSFSWRLVPSGMSSLVGVSLIQGECAPCTPCV